MEHLNVPQAEAEKVFDHHWGRGGGSKAKPAEAKKAEGAAGDESTMGSRAQTPALSTSTTTAPPAFAAATPTPTTASANASTPATTAPSNTTLTDTLPSISTARATSSKTMDPPRTVPARYQKSLQHESNKNGNDCPTPVAQTSSGLGRITIPPKVTRSITHTSSTTTSTEVHITRSQTSSSTTASRREKALEQQLEDALNELGRERELIAHLRKRLNQEGHANATIAGTEQAKRESLSQGYRDQINGELFLLFDLFLFV